jgi:hypothetical protein
MRGRQLRRRYLRMQFKPFGGVFGHPDDGVFFLEENANKLLDPPIGFDGVDNPARVYMADCEGG